MIAVADVPAASRFYQAVLGATSGHGGDAYERGRDRHRRACQPQRLHREIWLRDHDGYLVVLAEGGRR
jgi:catechol 2,3-dioxygenase-like lactoylglutathione lyase family enzyme